MNEWVDVEFMIDRIDEEKEERKMERFLGGERESPFRLFLLLFCVSEIPQTRWIVG